MKRKWKEKCHMNTTCWCLTSPNSPHRSSPGSPLACLGKPHYSQHMEGSKVSRSIPWMADKLLLPFSYQLCSKPNPAVSSPTFSPGLALRDPGFHPHLPNPYSFSCFIASQSSAFKWITLLCSPSQFSKKLPEKALRLLLNKAGTQSQTWHFCPS